MNSETEKYICDLVTNHPCDAYLNFHLKRYKAIADIIDSTFRPESRVLDVGPSLLTSILNKQFHNVDTLGLEEESRTSHGFHYRFDLNDCYHEDRWRCDFGKYDLIVMAEVLEHLYVPPVFVLKYIKRLLNAKGVLVLQTPNATSLYNRIKMFFGIQPFQLVRNKEITPAGHFREYDKDELLYYIEETGLEVKDLTLDNYFDYRFAFHHTGGVAKKRNYLWIVNWLYQICPSNFKPGITLVVYKS